MSSTHKMIIAHIFTIFTHYKLIALLLNTQSIKYRMVQVVKMIVTLTTLLTNSSLYLTVFDLMVSIFTQVSGRLFTFKPPIPGQRLLRTPYGGRLEVTMPQGNSLVVHFKDRHLIRHKKRWSQVYSDSGPLFSLWQHLCLFG